MVILYVGVSESTNCYVCGGLSLVADKCIDDYEIELRKEDMVDCSGVPGHTDGCMKSKYVDRDSRQIGE